MVLQCWLQSLPELGIIGYILYVNTRPEGPAVELNGIILMQVGCLGFKSIRKECSTGNVSKSAHTD
jgi:hypothetical protein